MLWNQVSCCYCFEKKKESLSQWLSGNFIVKLFLNECYLMAINVTQIVNIYEKNIYISIVWRLNLFLSNQLFWNVDILMKLKFHILPYVISFYLQRVNRKDVMLVKEKKRFEKFFFQCFQNISWTFLSLLIKFKQTVTILWNSRINCHWRLEINKSFTAFALGNFQPVNFLVWLGFNYGKFELCCCYKTKGFLFWLFESTFLQVLINCITL